MTLLKDGYSTTISFADDPTVVMYEKGVKVPGRNGGGAIDLTTHLNSTVTTKAPKSLVDWLAGSIRVSYDAANIAEIETMMLSNQEITITLPDLSTFVFWGWIEEWDPDEFVPGEQPMANIQIEVSNLNTSDVETKPVWAVAGP